MRVVANGVVQALQSEPAPVSSSAYAAGKLQEFVRRWKYVEMSYKFWHSVIQTDPSINASRALLEEAVKNGETDAVLGELHLEVRLAVLELARRHATERGQDVKVEASDREFGARSFLAALRPKRGARPARVLRYHVEGLMALLNETRGRPTRATSYKNSVYDPQASDDVTNIIVSAIRRVTPSVTVTAIVNIILATRKRERQKGCRPFMSYFPGYPGIAGNVEVVC